MSGCSGVANPFGETWLTDSIRNIQSSENAGLSGISLGQVTSSHLQAEIDRLKKENAELRASLSRVPPYHWLGADAEAVA